MDAETGWIVAWIALHIGGMATAYGTRVSVGSRLEGVIQLAFFAALLTIGAAIWACQQTITGAWGLSAVTLVAMVITAVADFRKLGDSRSVGQAY
jgi:hypothetical protein